MKYLLGIDIGGTKTAIVIGDMAGTRNSSVPPKIVERKVFQTDHNAEPLNFINRILDEAVALLKNNNVIICDLFICFVRYLFSSLFQNIKKELCFRESNWNF